MSILDDFYPGSRERRQDARSRPSGIEEDMLGPGMTLVLRGQRVEFFTIGQVARAINRTATTLRSWEADGTLPPSGYVKPSDDPRGRRRLYTRAQCMAIIEIAKATGLMDVSKRPDRREFKRLIWPALNELRRAEHARPSQGTHRQVR